jgi:hypothetical protein
MPLSIISSPSFLSSRRYALLHRYSGYQALMPLSIISSPSFLSSGA